MLKRFTRALLSPKLVVLLAFAVVLPLAQASVLSGGGSAAPTPLFPGGTQIAMISGLISTPTFSTNYTEWVYRDPNNSWCVNCLDFVFQFTNNGPDLNARFTMFDYSGFMLDVGTNPFGGPHDPQAVDRSTSGAIVAWNYELFPIGPFVTTPLLVIETDAPGYKMGYVSVQDGTAYFGNAYAPTVPEPGTMLLFGSGVIGLAVTLRRKINL